MTAAVVLGTIPSPTHGTWHLGPLPVRAYALCIVAGIVVAIWLGERRWVARGGAAGQVSDIAIWAVPFGVVGGRIYHVVTSPADYFGENGDPWRALRIWQGGLGIWGAIALGGFGVWLAVRRAGLRLPPMADAVAPGIVLAQAFGRWGNWFNNELYGGPTDLPWRLKVYQWDLAAGHARLDAAGNALPLSAAQGGPYRHPTFLYEFVWDVAVAVLLLWADRRFRLGHGRVFALYVMAYTAGRVWIEALRTDPATHVLGLRINIWTSIVVFAAAAIGFWWSHRRAPGRETPEQLRRSAPAEGPSVTEGDDAVLDGEPSASLTPEPHDRG